MSREKNDLVNFARSARSIVKWLAGILILVYGWLELKDVPIGAIVGSVSGDTFVKIALGLYYLSWVGGLLNDTDEQEIAYVRAPNRGRFPWQGVSIGIALTTVFAVLCFVGSAKQFSLVLALFLAINVAGYVYLLSVVTPTKTESQNEYAAKGDRQGNRSRPGGVFPRELIWT